MYVLMQHRRSSHIGQPVTCRAAIPIVLVLGMVDDDAAAVTRHLAELGANLCDWLVARYIYRIPLSFF